MMFFHDGNLSEIAETDTEVQVRIDAGDGISNNMKRLNEVLESKMPYIVVTNQVALLNTDWLWDKTKHHPNLCLLDRSDKKWKPVGRFTKKVIRNKTNIESMAVNGEFQKTASKEKIQPMTRNVLKFRITQEDGKDEDV